MSQVILRRTKDAAVSAAEAVTVVTDTATCGRVLSQTGNNMLAEVPHTRIGGLSARLPGWIISEQMATVPRPDARIRARRR
ncbi:hypothetical protein [Roseateles sp. P5_E11]